MIEREFIIRDDIGLRRAGSKFTRVASRYKSKSGLSRKQDWQR